MTYCHTHCAHLNYTWSQGLCSAMARRDVAVAALVGVRAVYVADESSQTLQVWDDESEEGKPVQVRLQPLQPRC